MRNFDYEGRAPWDYTPNILSSAERPYLAVANLDANIDFELVWFDDRPGTIIGRVDDPFAVEPARLPDTEPGGGFGKSVAFLIQPAGYTPWKTFAELPNEPIGQITLQELEGTENWHEERPTATTNLTYTFVFRSRSAEPLNLSQCYFRWELGNGVSYPDEYSDPPILGNYSVSHHYSSASDYEVKTEVFSDAAGLNRICGDVINVRAVDPPN